MKLRIFDKLNATTKLMAINGGWVINVKLSVKLFRIVFLISLILIFFLYMFSKTFLLKNFTDIEIDKAHKDTEVVLNYIKKDLYNLNSMNSDYARWDNTYNYLNNRNKDYISSNFSDTTSMAKAKISFIIITDSLGNTVLKKYSRREKEYIYGDFI